MKGEGNVMSVRNMRVDFTGKKVDISDIFTCLAGSPVRKIATSQYVLVYNFIKL